MERIRHLSRYALLAKQLRSKNKGQALVEFTLCFILLLIVAWIPADFGLAFYTGQMALNASREGARIAAVTKSFSSAGMADITEQTCKRITTALLEDPGSGFGASCLPYSNARVAVASPIGTACNQQITVSVTGDYNYFFFGLLKVFGAPIPSSVRMTRLTEMRWEHQDTCPVSS